MPLDRINLNQTKFSSESNSGPSLLQMTVIAIGCYLIGRTVYNRLNPNQMPVRTLTILLKNEYTAIENYASITARMTEAQTGQFNKKVVTQLKLDPVEELTKEQIQKFDNELVKREAFYKKNEADTQKAWHMSALGNYKTLAPEKHGRIIRKALVESYVKEKSFDAGATSPSRVSDIQFLTTEGNFQAPH